MKFSERKKYKEVKNQLQKDNLDQQTRNGIWNVYIVTFWRPIQHRGLDGFTKPFFIKLFDEFFKHPIDTMPGRLENLQNWIRGLIIEKLPWYEVFDLIEFTSANFNIPLGDKESFVSMINNILQRELSSFRLLGDIIVEINSGEEIKEIEKALEHKDVFRPISIHLQNALKLLSDRKTPDYRNSIKESISAVEAICILIAGKKATLGQALKEVEKKVELHGALKSGFSSLYGWTSEDDGIRHALMNGQINVDFEEARFMLISCSAFVNYLIEKVGKTGIL